MKKVILVILAAVVLGTGTFFYLQAQTSRDKRFNYDPGDKFVTDMPNSRRMLSADMVLQMADSDREAYFESNNHRIRNTVIFVLRSKSEDDMKDKSIETTLKEEIIRRLNAEFECTDFLKVYFNEFVIQ